MIDWPILLMDGAFRTPSLVTHDKDFFGSVHYNAYCSKPPDLVYQTKGSARRTSARHTLDTVPDDKSSSTTVNALKNTHPLLLKHGHDS